MYTPIIVPVITSPYEDPYECKDPNCKCPCHNEPDPLPWYGKIISVLVVIFLLFLAAALFFLVVTTIFEWANGDKTLWEAIKDNAMFVIDLFKRLY